MSIYVLRNMRKCSFPSLGFSLPKIWKKWKSLGVGHKEPSPPAAKLPRECWPRYVFPHPAATTNGDATAPNHHQMANQLTTNSIWCLHQMANQCSMLPLNATVAQPHQIAPKVYQCAKWISVCIPIKDLPPNQPAWHAEASCRCCISEYTNTIATLVYSFTCYPHFWQV